MMSSGDALSDIRAAVHSADRHFQIIDGGKDKKGGGGPPEAPQQEEDCPVVTIGHLDGAFIFWIALASCVCSRHRK